MRGRGVREQLWVASLTMSRSCHRTEFPYPERVTLRNDGTRVVECLTACRRAVVYRHHDTGDGTQWTYNAMYGLWLYRDQADMLALDLCLPCHPELAPFVAAPIRRAG